MKPVALAVTRAHARPGTGLDANWGTEVTRILCIRLDNLGDVLMSTPALHALRSAVPGRSITLLASRAGAAAAAFVDVIDEVIEYDAPWMKHDAPPDPAADLAMCERLRAERFDAAVIFTVYSQNPLPAAMLCHLAGIPRRLAHCRENPYSLLTSWVAETEPEHGTRHEVERQLALVARVGAHALDTTMRFAVPPASTISLAAKLHRHGVDTRAPYFIVHPGATAASRRYPAARFADVSARLAERSRWPVLVTGGLGEAPITALVAASHPLAIDMAGALELGELAALIRDARVLISNNSGPVHIASALRTPVVDLYALTNPQHGPWMTPHRVLSHDVPCRWCYRSLCPEGHHQCLEGVSVDEVVDAVQQLLDSPPGTTRDAPLATS